MNRPQIEEKWDQATAIPLLVLSLVFLFLYAAPIINPELDPAVQAAFDIGQTVIWAIFVIDFVGRFILASKKLVFLRRNVIELLAVMLPMLRPLRALRLLSVVTIGLRRVGESFATESHCTFLVLRSCFGLSLD